MQKLKKEIIILSLVAIMFLISNMVMDAINYQTFPYISTMANVSAIAAIVIILNIEINKRIKAEKMLDMLINNIPYPLYYKNANEEYVECNSSFVKLVKLDKKKIIGKKNTDIFANEFGNKLKSQDEELMKNGGIQVYEFNGNMFNENERDYIIRKEVIYDKNQKIEGIMGVLFDITEIKTLSEKVVKVEKVDRTRKEFFSNISHDLRTPISVILSAIQNIENEKVYNENYILMLKQNSYRLLKLVNNLIDMSKIDAGYYKVNLGNHNIVSVVEDVVLSVVGYIKNNKLKVLFDTDIEEKVIACDPEKIERIMLNLISNAIKFTPENGEIKVTVTDKGKSIIICVSDNGIGIDKSKIDNVFQRFAITGQSVMNKKEGSGIGLSLVKSLTEMHGGKVWVESQENKGTSFFIEIPSKKIELEGNQGKNSCKNNRMVNVELGEIKKQLT